MFKDNVMPDPQLAGNAGTILAASILHKLVEKGILTQYDANQTVLGAIASIEGIGNSWAKPSRDALVNLILPAFPAE